ncbi:type 4a pilus biogenesis protein PilO [Methyloradius palustris]|uniref:Transmembrane protein n=1 Tax=Methyloradius palustris TaxID=2778876 RepID=A0A8D5K1D3_9PROT|nr:type 4a pilus biogenesis protein PilO [Methyloradius palustris]BCM25648.1 hypothetical protein ZMTM_19070 [Methyloradius palustris]
MAALKVAAIWAEVVYRTRLVGWQSLLGVVLLLVSAVLILAMLLPKQGQLEQLKHEAALREASPKQVNYVADNSPQTSINAFYKLLPAEDQAPKAFQQILVMANDQGVEPEKSEYQSARNPSAIFTRYQMTLPMHGRYLDIRKFVIQVLNTLPNVALSEISFKRDEANPEQVEARLRFSIYTTADNVRGAM